MFCTYILRSEVHPGRVYHGHTSDLRRRLRDHNSGDNGSTCHGPPWVIAWYGAFETDAAAMAFERSLKTASGKAFSRKRLLMLLS